MLETIQEGTKDHQEHLKLKGLKDYGPSWALFESTVEEITVNFHQTMKTLNKEKIKVWTYCKQTLRDAEIEAESKSINFIRAFNSLRKHKINELQGLDDKSMQIDDYETSLMDAVAALEDNLMDLEMHL